MTASRTAGRIVTFGTKPQGNYAHVKKLQRHGLTWDSKKEADRYDDLLLLERAGHIRNVRRQVLYRFEVNGILIAKYTADFVYEELTKVRAPGGRDSNAEIVWVEVTEDVKGYPNERWPMKRKLFRALFGREIRIT